MTEIKGVHVLAVFLVSFGIIIAVNMTLAVNAVRSFPGLEVKNSYVASQVFDQKRRAQEALGWEVAARLQGNTLRLEFVEQGRFIEPKIIAATFGRATHVGQDQIPNFVFDGTGFTANVVAGRGNWNLRVRAMADDGTPFLSRLIVKVQP